MSSIRRAMRLRRLSTSSASTATLHAEKPPLLQEKSEKGALREKPDASTSMSCTTAPSLAQSPSPTSPSLLLKRKLEDEADQEEKKRSKKCTMSTLHPRPKGNRHVEPKEASPPLLCRKLEEIELHFSLELQDLPSDLPEEEAEPSAFTPLHILVAEANPPDVSHPDDLQLHSPGYNAALFTEQEEEELKRVLLCLIDRCSLDEVMKMEVSCSATKSSSGLSFADGLRETPASVIISQGMRKRLACSSLERHATVPALHHGRHLQHLRAEDVQASKDVVDSCLQQDEEDHVEESNDLFLSFLDLYQ